MKRLRIHVEGQTEEKFVHEILAEHLYDPSFGYWEVVAVLIGNARQRSHRGGGKSWASVRKGILTQLRQDPDLVVTTMVDFYALPQDWPSKSSARHAREIEAGMHEDIADAMGPGFHQERFIGFVIMHEFEALLFSSPDQLGSVLGVNPEQLWQIRNQFSTPEEINDSVHTAPSKRIEGLQRKYEKVLDGIECARKIGLAAMRDQCPHFAQWLRKLEALGASPPPD